mgnify:CR=1 FL=1
MRILPDVLRLIRRLAADRTLSRGVRVRLALLLASLQAAAAPPARQVFIVGDSTVRTGTRGQVGWGDPIVPGQPGLRVHRPPGLGGDAVTVAEVIDEP